MKENLRQPGPVLGQLLFAAGQRDEAIKILTRSREGFLKLGNAEMAEQTQTLIDQISKPPE